MKMLYSKCVVGVLKRDQFTFKTFSNPSCIYAENLTLMFFTTDMQILMLRRKICKW